MVHVTVRVVSFSGGAVGGAYLDYLHDKLDREAEREIEADQARDHGDEGLADYYANSIKSFWHGEGATRLGLSGAVGKEDLAAIFAGVDPSSGERMGRKFGDKSVRGFDTTFACLLYTSPSPRD